LRDLGSAEGRNFVLEQRSAGNVVSRLDALAGELLAQRVEVVVTHGTPAARALSRASETMPIVVALGEPVRARLIEGNCFPPESRKASDSGVVRVLSSVSCDNLSCSRLRGLRASGLMTNKQFLGTRPSAL
jgi:hypothetical protein